MEMTKGQVVLANVTFANSAHMVRIDSDGFCCKVQILN